MINVHKHSKGPRITPRAFTIFIEEETTHVTYEKGDSL